MISPKCSWISPPCELRELDRSTMPKARIVHVSDLLAFIDHPSADRAPPSAMREGKLCRLARLKRAHRWLQMNSPHQGLRYTWSRLSIMGSYSCILFRFMALNDLMNEISRHPSTLNKNVELKTIEHVMELIGDTISEVKNIAVQWLACLPLRDRPPCPYRITALGNSPR